MKAAARFALLAAVLATAVVDRRNDAASRLDDAFDDPESPGRMKQNSHSSSVALAVVLAISCSATSVQAQRHPHFDDRGTLAWHTKLEAAKAAARATDRVILVQYGREACRTCRSLVERALPDARIKDRIAALAVGLAAECDSPEPGVEAVMTGNLPNATALPFVGFLTCDGKWIDGYSGWLEEPQLLEVIARIEKSPLLDAMPATRKQLEKAAASATAAASKGDWKVALAAAREAAKSNGRCAERTAIRTAEQQARNWAREQLEACVHEAARGHDLAPARKRLAAVRQHFAGEPEATDCDTGAKALQRLQVVREVEAGGNPAKDLRPRSAEPYKGTRWAAVFDKPAAQPLDK